MRTLERACVDLVTVIAVCLAIAVPLDARADDLSPSDLATIDQALGAPTPPVCTEAHDHLQALREAYDRQPAPVVRSAIAARVPMALDTLRFCLETSSSNDDAIEPSRRALASARARSECGEPVGDLERLIAAWEAERSTVVRLALESRLDALAQTVRFCLETLGPEASPEAPGTSGRAPSEGRALGSPFTRPR